MRRVVFLNRMDYLDKLFLVKGLSLSLCAYFKWRRTSKWVKSIRPQWASPGDAPSMSLQPLLA